MKKQILFVGEDQRLGQEFGNSDVAGEWSVRLACTDAEALALTGVDSFDVVVADAELSELYGVDFLDKIMDCQPKALRIVLSEITDVEQTLHCVGRVHHHLAKPCDVTKLRKALNDSLAGENWLPSEAVPGLMARMRYLPSPPTVYFQIASAMQSEHATVESVGEIIAQDPAVTAKVLQLANSAVFGLQLQVSHPAQAVSYLGMETTQALVLMAHTFAPFLHMELAGLSAESLWRHSTATGQIARQIARRENSGSKVGDQAFAAGLLHDIGKLLFAANLPEPFGQVLALARAQKRTVWETEIQVMGACHAEVGACLLGIWGLPKPIVEAVALHHRPERLAERTFSPLTAVHVASALEHEISGETAVFVPAELNLRYLAELNLEERLQDWRADCAPKSEAATF
ncbi:MAG: response regulator [Verrucomicrobiota bacterium]